MQIGRQTAGISLACLRSPMAKGAGYHPLCWLLPWRELSLRELPL
ncbi:MAG: hypothetical protein ACI8Z1_001593 [Candidatus Azotimanducaceae bacterium]|jgi:hypothetical protein